MSRSVCPHRKLSSVKTVFQRKGGARFGIVTMNGIRDLAVLRREIREMLL